MYYNALIDSCQRACICTSSAAIGHDDGVPALPNFTTLADRAAAIDGVDPLSETSRLALRHATPTYIVTDDAGRYTGGAVIGDDGATEIVVDPNYRSRGCGRRLVQAVLSERPNARLWAHNDLPAAQHLARQLGLTVVRNLWRMTHPANSVPLITNPVVPKGFSTRSFIVGKDEDTWLAVNAHAFVHHPEQGRMTHADLEERMAESWFDPTGLLLIEDDATGALAASHWTKVEPESLDGEAYVVAVDPDYQGRGLGRTVTSLGLAHLKSVGVQSISLYVENNNTPAIATYTRLGFTRNGVDVMYATPDSAQ